jgi:hypothetical protein
MKVQARGFVTKKSWGDYGPLLTRYVVSIVHEVSPEGVKASISGEVPLIVDQGSDVDKALSDALTDGVLVNVVVEIGEK